MIAHKAIFQESRLSPASRGSWSQSSTSAKPAPTQWLRSIAQGDPWNHVSHNVPAGRGPFKSWKEAAIDALTKCAPYASKWRDWTIGGALTLIQEYNGVGYGEKPSPYMLAGLHGALKQDVDLEKFRVGSNDGRDVSIAMIQAEIEAKRGAKDLARPLEPPHMVVSLDGLRAARQRQSSSARQPEDGLEDRDQSVGASAK